MNKYKILNGTAIELPNKNVVVYNDSYTVSTNFKAKMIDETTIETNHIGIFGNCFKFEKVQKSYYNYFRLNKPVIDDPYFYIDESGKIYRRYWEDDNEDNYCWNNNNCFVDEDTAETFKSNNDRFAPLLKKMEIEFAKEGEIDWNDYKHKYDVYYSKRKNHIGYEQWDSVDNGSMRYCYDKEIVKNFINENEEELKAYFKWMQEYNSWKGIE
jgi:hypothetical protein